MCVFCAVWSLMTHTLQIHKFSKFHIRKILKIQKLELLLNETLSLKVWFSACVRHIYMYTSICGDLIQIDGELYLLGVVEVGDKSCSTRPSLCRRISDWEREIHVCFLRRVVTHDAHTSNSQILQISHPKNTENTKTGNAIERNPVVKSLIFRLC